MSSRRRECRREGEREEAELTFERIRRDRVDFRRGGSGE